MTKRSKKGKKNKRQAGEAAALRNYLLALDTIGRQIVRADSYGAAADKAYFDQIMIPAWLRAREARLFVLEPDAWRRLHNAAMDISETVLGFCATSVGYTADPETDPPTDEQSAEMVDALGSFVQSMDLPEQLPFEDMWLAFGAGCRPPESEWPFLLPQLHREGVELQDMIFLAYLLTTDVDSSPVVFSVFRVIRHDGTEGFAWQSVYHQDQWVDIHRADYVIVPSIIQALNSFRTYILEQRPPASHYHDRRTLRNKVASPLPPPKPYYTINLKSTVINLAAERQAQQAVAAATRRAPGHRYDVAGCEVCRIVREPKPADPAVVAGLKARGYNVYLDDDPSPEDQARLDTRLIDPKAPGEMLAIQTVWRKAHVKGPKNAPYVPSIRRVPEVA